MSKFLQYLGMGVLVVLTATHHYTDYKAAGKEYTGVILEKAYSVGRSTTHYFEVDYGHTTDVIVVHPLDYKKAEVGDMYTVRTKYTPFIGIGGTAYLPEHAIPFGTKMGLFLLFCEGILLAWILSGLIIRGLGLK